MLRLRRTYRRDPLPAEAEVRESQPSRWQHKVISAVLSVATIHSLITCPIPDTTYSPTLLGQRLNPLTQ